MALTTKAITPTDTPPLSPRLHTPRVRSVLRLRLPRPPRLTPSPAPSAPSRDRFSSGAVTPPTQREARRAVHASLGVPRVVLLACSGLPIMSQARSATRARARPGAMARPPTARPRSLARAFLRPSRVLRRSARARSPTRTHPPSPSLKPCAVGLSALRRPAAQGGAGRGQLSFTDLGTPLHPPRPESEALPSWM